MPKLPVVASKKLIKVLRKLGFIHIHGKGSHMFFAHPDGRKTVVAAHGREIPKGTLLAILDDIQLTKAELSSLL